MAKWLIQGFRARGVPISLILHSYCIFTALLLHYHFILHTPSSYSTLHTPPQYTLHTPHPTLVYPPSYSLRLLESITRCCAPWNTYLLSCLRARNQDSPHRLRTFGSQYEYAKSFTSTTGVCACVLPPPPAPHVLSFSFTSTRLRLRDVPDFDFLDGCSARCFQVQVRTLLVAVRVIVSCTKAPRPGRGSTPATGTIPWDLDS